MTFIERFLGLSPDNNSGATEFAIIVALAAALVALQIVSRRLKRSTF
jgi:hypothetical protein